MTASHLYHRLLRPVAAAALLLTAANLQAATHIVDSLYDDGYGSLRAAVRNSASGDTILFNVGGTITLSNGEIVIRHDLTIQGPNDGSLAVMGTGSRVFYIAGGKVDISNLAVSGSAFASFGDADGGAILNAGNLTLTEMTIWGSFAGGAQGSYSDASAGPGGSGRGGGIANLGTLTVLRCAIYGNRAVGGSGGGSNYGSAGTGGTGAGGAIYNGGYLTVLNTTLHGCVANGGTGGNGPSGGNGGTGAGGAIYNGGVLDITNCTVTSNTTFGGKGGPAGYGGGGVGGGLIQINGSGVTTVRNVIVATNGATASGPDVSGNFNSQGHNLIGRTDGSYGWGGTDLLGGTSDATRLDPQLGDLQANGGPTITRLPSGSSPAVDAGNDAALTPPVSLGDQRGFPRKQGAHIDIGATERGVTQSGSHFTVTTTDEHDDGACTSDECTLVEAVRAANADPDASIIDFAPSVAGTISTVSTPGGLPITAPVTIIGPGARTVDLTAVGEGRVLEVTAANVVISGLTIRNGRVYAQDGGGIRNFGGLTIVECAISGNATNSAPHGGAGIYNAPGASLTLLRTSVQNNFGDTTGGGISNEGALFATNCTFMQNFAITGGGIFSRPAGGTGGMVLRNCTITGNTAASGGTGFGDGGAGIYADGFPQQNDLGNTISAANTSYTYPPTNPDVRGNFTSAGHNFIGNTGYSTGFVDGLNGDQAGSLALPRNPMLAAAADNGGGTNTVALLPGSPAINAGSNDLAPPMDQRSFARAGASDIGAFEFNGTPFTALAPRIDSITRGGGGQMIVRGTATPGTTVTLFASPNPTPSSFAPLTEVVTDANGAWHFEDSNALATMHRFYRLQE